MYTRDGVFEATHHYWQGEENDVEIDWTEEVLNPGRPEILGHIIPAQSHALGAVPDAGGTGTEVLTPVNLQSSPLGFTNSNYDHSAQFLNSHHTRQGFWVAVLEATRLEGEE